MKVFYVSSGLDGCYNVRCLLPLQHNGWDGDRTSFAPYNMTPENKALAAKSADVVVFHRPDTDNKLKLARLLKAEGKKIVFDNDDTVKDDGGFKFNEYMNKERLERGLKTLNQNIDAFIKEADLVTCSTKFLADEYSKLNDNVVVLPNCVDPFYFDEPLRNEGDKIRIGITGSVAITSDMEVLEPIVKHYENDPRVQLVMFSMPDNKEEKIVYELYKDEYDFWGSVNIEWHPFVNAHEYYDKLNELRLDMVIIPRHDNLFNRCKSNLKFLENSMFEIPSICQSFPTGDSPYQQNPEDSKHLLLANTFNEWIEQIESLITNKNKRQALGEGAKEYVIENYSIDKHGDKWKEAYQKLIK